MQEPPLLLNRELSWLDFDRRVLALAEDPARPLLERVKFLAIFSQNLDEFFQVRVAGLQDQVEAGVGTPSPDGRSPRHQLVAIRERVLEWMRHAEELFERQLRPALDDAGIHLCSWNALPGAARKQAQEQFETEIRPVLVPLSVDPTHPFPYISGLSLNVGALVQRQGGGETRLVRVKVPPFLPGLWRLQNSFFVRVEELILAHLAELFPEDQVISAGSFRVTRDADLEIRERESVDLVRDIEAGLRRRLRGSDAVRLEVDRCLAGALQEALVRELRLEPDEAFETGFLDFGRLWELYRLDRSELKDLPSPPRSAAGLPAREGQPEALFATLRSTSFLVHHPYESFETSVEEFLRAAAGNPSVRVVMSTIYRTGGPESGIVQALARAASSGKQVVVLVELKARFDEAANLERARALERAGAHVVYGVAGLKTHAKIALAVRQESDGLRRYCHVGTGNYNPITARLYEDLGLLTAEADVTRDVAELFNRLTSSSGARSYRRMLVAPESLRSGLLARIRREADAEDGRIILKVNNLSDPEMIDALYEASRAGAEIDLIVRSICCLRPGVVGLSERVRVRSIVGRYLEHSRIFCFGSAARGVEYWIGSADLMARNLDGRVEAVVSVQDSRLKERLAELLALYLRPDVRAWELSPDGSWKPTAGTLDVQAALADPRPD